jgi:hypothetical protein
VFTTAVTAPFSDLDYTNPYPPTLFITTHFNITLRSTALHHVILIPVLSLEITGSIVLRFDMTANLKCRPISKQILPNVETFQFQ